MDHKEVIFISHANPEDNDFTEWIALKLAGMGYQVWSDLTNLLGGEKIWSNVESILRTATTKFLFVLSESSNHKNGCISEVSLANQISKKNGGADFIIPLRIDKIDPVESNIHISELNFIDFSDSWSDGLIKLLEKLNKSNIKKYPENSLRLVTDWWEANKSHKNILKEETTAYPTNEYESLSTPDFLYFHRIEKKGSIGKYQLDHNIIPLLLENTTVITFADADELGFVLRDEYEVKESNHIKVCDILSDAKLPTTKHRRELRKYMMTLLKEAIRLKYNNLGLKTHEFANKRNAFYFLKGQIENDNIFFNDLLGKKTYRGIVGYKTTKKGDVDNSRRYWHFALEIQPKLTDKFSFFFVPHVVFSDDGKIIWDSDRKLHAARRNQCKNWWNDEWRDRIAAMCHWLCGENDFIELSLGVQTSLKINKNPLFYTLPIRIDDSLLKNIDEDVDFSDEEEDVDMTFVETEQYGELNNE